VKVGKKLSTEIKKSKGVRVLVFFVQ